MIQDTVPPAQIRIAHPGALFFHGNPVFMQQLRLVEEPIPGIHVLLLQRPLAFVHHLIEAAGLHAVPDGLNLPRGRTVQVRQEHGVGIPVPYLLREDIHKIVFRVGIQVQEQLGGVEDSIDGVKGMPPPDDGEKGHCVQDEQERAGNPEEVAHHQVGGPGGLQFRKAVEHVESVFSFLFNDPMNLARESLEPMGKRNAHPA